LLRKANELELSVNLLDNPPGLIARPGDLNACINAYGLYNSIQFVLRLSPEVHRRIEALPEGIVSKEIVSREIGPDSLQAYSTYLHETIHWWQHVGSTISFMLSLSFPAQAHANYTRLKKLLAALGPKKSVRRLIQTLGKPGNPEEAAGLANIVVNNHFDIEFFRAIITNPSMLQEVVKHELFDCVGHSYEVAYSNTLAILASTLDENCLTLPDPRGWENEFAALRMAKRKGYFYKSDVLIAPLGAHEIFEGQARFAQLQFLYFASGGELSWDDIRSRGMLGGIYGKAFESFLQGTQLEWPKSVNDPTVALFLLICDMAINPGAGFPMPLRFFQTFIEDVDPGIRFLFLCRAVANKCPDVAGAITRYSRDEYVQVSEALALPLAIDPPLAVAEKVARWAHGSEGLKSLMAQHRSFDYASENLLVRVLFSHFLAFNEDKFARPEFFCWPGPWMAGERVSQESAALFDRHSALFFDKADDDGVFPRIFPDKNEAIVHRTFESFYAFNITYDMTRQWIARPGPFEYDYRWLSSSSTRADIKVFADRHFKMVYDAHPDSFELI
jgi:hypothetical protein